MDAAGAGGDHRPTASARSARNTWPTPRVRTRSTAADSSRRETDGRPALRRTIASVRTQGGGPMPRRGSSCRSGPGDRRSARARAGSRSRRIPIGSTRAGRSDSHGDTDTRPPRSSSTSHARAGAGDRTSSCASATLPRAHVRAPETAGSVAGASSNRRVGGRGGDPNGQRSPDTGAAPRVNRS